MKENNQNSENKISQLVNSSGRDWFQQKGKKALFVVVVLAIILAYFLSYSQGNVEKEQVNNKRIGIAYTYLYNKNYTQAQKELEKLLTEDLSGLLESKVSLLYGNVLYEQKKYEQALMYFKKLKLSPQKYPLLQGGAEFGIVTSYMQLKNYDQALNGLEGYIKTYFRLSLDETDLVPNIADALWKKALCHSQLNQKQKIPAILDFLKKHYFQSQQKKLVEELLAVL